MEVDIYGSFKYYLKIISKSDLLWKTLSRSAKNAIPAAAGKVVSTKSEPFAKEIVDGKNRIASQCSDLYVI